MANTKSAKKNVVKSEKRRLKNLARKTAIKTAMKKVVVAIEEKSANVDILLSDVAAKLARAKSKNVLHPRTASRKLSRLAKRVNASKKELAV